MQSPENIFIYAVIVGILMYGIYTFVAKPYFQKKKIEKGLEDDVNNESEATITSEFDESSK